MECPKCHFDHPQQTDECLKCGVIFAKYRAFQEAVEAVHPVEPGQSAQQVGEEQQKAQHEFFCRIFALAVALLLGWLSNYAMPMLTYFLAMWLHESGHAITAWFCGYAAFPTAWITLIPNERGRWISIVLGAAVAVGGYFAFRLQRWFWVVVSAAVLGLFVLGNLQTESHARLLFTFWGEGGAYVLSTVLMLTFYARPDSSIARNQVRWGLLILGAMAFWSVYTRWSGGFENIAQFLEDTDDRGIPSDMRVLTQIYGWSTFVLINRYRMLGHACLIVLAGAYTAGLVQIQRRKSALAEQIRESASAIKAGIIG
ncbi:MAG TPA: hypothetical protein VG897_19460 [Terriglobales bacterium]|nr:hypothetical protein [Terriglobales bacterium]